MNKSKNLFYVYDEHTDYVKQCIKMGMIPQDRSSNLVESFIFDNVKYVLLGQNECYSGWEHNIMAMPQLSYERLMHLALHSNVYDERVGSLGILLKSHFTLFENNFINLINEDFQNKKQIKKMSKLILNEINNRSFQVSQMTNLLYHCKII